MKIKERSRRAGYITVTEYVHDVLVNSTEEQLLALLEGRPGRRTAEELEQAKRESEKRREAAAKRRAEKEGGTCNR